MSSRHESDRQVVAACDLDRTLVYSATALALRGHDADAPELLVAEVYHGKPLSFITRRAGQALSALSDVAWFVPCTTRTREQYARIRLPVSPPQFAVCANGGFILVDGKADDDWSKVVRARLTDQSAPLSEVDAHLRTVCDYAWTRKLRMAEELFVYAVVERDELPSGFVAELTAWCAPRGWEVSLQGRKLYCVPATLTKGKAITEVARRTGATAVLAAGDSLLDAELLDSADEAVRPAHGELHDIDWRRDHLTVTRTAGVSAGEEIALLLLARARSLRAAVTPVAAR